MSPFKCDLPQTCPLQNSSFMAFISTQVTSLRQPCGGIHLHNPARTTPSWLAQWCALGAGTWGTPSWLGRRLICIFWIWISLSHMSRPGFEPRQWWETAYGQWRRLRPHGRQSRPPSYLNGDKYKLILNLNHSDGAFGLHWSQKVSSSFRELSEGRFWALFESFPVW